ncbi:hypothetical protein C943_02796 [Mariniradius saccharolyticus AK6]|uniref:Uncharacterized protein n=1 Tax=Mariniradius saccharolyticus AK6 TaxID=1239962 RepID=M7X7H1_9BACT|nr:hypothetical protein C943_02796 [Mariniradius saccharolyticus AK6]
MCGCCCIAAIVRNRPSNGRRTQWICLGRIVRYRCYPAVVRNGWLAEGHVDRIATILAGGYVQGRRSRNGGRDSIPYRDSLDSCCLNAFVLQQSPSDKCCPQREACWCVIDECKIRNICAYQRRRAEINNSRGTSPNVRTDH